MKVNFECYFKSNWMVCTDSTIFTLGGLIMEYEISIAINVDLTHVFDICIIVLLYLIM